MRPRPLLSAPAVLVLAACGTTSSSPDDAAAPVDAAADAPVILEDAAPDGRSSTDAALDAAAGRDAGPPYDQVLLADRPVAYWAMRRAGSTEPDLSGHGHDGTYAGTSAPSGALPNGDPVAVFDGATGYLTVPTSAAFSVPTTGELTWEAWIRPDVLQFPNVSNEYVDWMGKCARYAPTCEWEARMYTTTNAQGRCNRMSAYVFNPTAGLGSAADWQPTCGLIQAGTWLHVVGEYTTKTQPATCPNSAMYPGAIDVWVDGVKWDQAAHAPTGCMSQYQVVPQANDSPLTIGTMAMDSWFPGGIGKVAIYDRLLTSADVARHYRAMTGKDPSGSCADTCTVP